MSLVNLVFEEVKEVIASALGYTDQTRIIAEATKLIRFDWRSLVSLWDRGGDGINPPYVVVRPLPTMEAYFGLAADCWYQPFEIYYIDSERNRASATATTGASYANPITVTNTNNMFVGQEIWFDSTSPQVLTTIESILSPTSIKAASAIPSNITGTIVSDVTSDVAFKTEKIKLAFTRGGSFTNFQVMEDPGLFISDLNPANDYFLSGNYGVYAASATVNLLVGRII
jgi:hypothetical protein